MMYLLTGAAESDDGMRYIAVRDAIVSIPGNVTRRPQLVTRSFRPSQPLAEVPSAALHQQAQCPQPAHKMPLRRPGKSSGWLSMSTGGTEPDSWTGVTHPVALPPRATTLAPRHEPQSPSPSHRHPHRHHPTVRRIAPDCIDGINQAASFLSTRTVAGPIADHGTAGHHRGAPLGTIWGRHVLHRGEQSARRLLACTAAAPGFDL